MPEVYGGSSDAMLRRLLSRKGISEQQRESLLATVEQRGSAYLPQVNAFYVREFQMAYAAEDVARFLHQACQGLPHRLNGHATIADDEAERYTTDHFFARVLEHAVAYFGARVLHPSPATPIADEPALLSRAACEKAARAAVLADRQEFEESTQDWGYRIGRQIYDAYLAGKAMPSSVRRLFLLHLNQPGIARKACATVISKLRSIARA